ncbi:unnamed protein product, partial [Choristocarpus tenellus]
SESSTSSLWRVFQICSRPRQIPFIPKNETTSTISLLFHAQREGRQTVLYRPHQRVTFEKLKILRPISGTHQGTRFNTRRVPQSYGLCTLAFKHTFDWIRDSFWW